MQIRKCHQSLRGRSGEKEIIKISHLHTFAVQAGLDLSNVVAASTRNPFTSHEFEAEFRGKNSEMSHTTQHTTCKANYTFFFSLWEMSVKLRVCSECVRVTLDPEETLIVLSHRMSFQIRPSFFRGSCSSKTRYGPSLSPSAVSHKNHVFEE